MDDIEDHHGSISRSFSHKPYPLNHNPNPSTSNAVPRRFRSRDPQFPRPNPNLYAVDDGDEDGDEEELDDDEDDQGFGDDGGDFYRHPKKRRLRSLNSSYELAPRVVGNGNGDGASVKGRGFLRPEEEWSERGVFVLLEVWGERFVELGRTSLRSEDWREVAERVSEVSGLERTEIQCRNMMNLLKKKYRKEKARIEQQPGPRASRWGYFRKMDALLAPPQAPPRQAFGLACGVDSGEFVFANPRVYLDQSNGHDEMRDSPVESEASEDEDGSDSDGTPPRGAGRGGVGDGDGASLASMRVLTDSIQKFGEIYGKIESNKRQQMMELENMRREFCRDLELQKKQIMERTQAEIAKIREEEDEDEEEDEEGDTGGSAEDLSE